MREGLDLMGLKAIEIDWHLAPLREEKREKRGRDANSARWTSPLPILQSRDGIQRPPGLDGDEISIVPPVFHEGDAPLPSPVGNHLMGS